MDPLRILHCIPSMGGGGAERQLSYLTRALADLRWTVEVALGSSGPNVERLREGGARIHPLAPRRAHDVRRVTELLQVVRRVKPDLVQVWFRQMEVLGGIAAELAGVPWILSERSSAGAYPPTLKHRLRVVLGRRADAIISNSRGGDEYWRTRLDGRVRQYVIPNAVPFDEIAAVQPVTPHESGLGSEQRVVLFVGRMSTEKNLGTLIAALRVVLARPRTMAVLCGEGPLGATVERWLAEAGIGDRVRRVGYVPNAWSWMKRADVMVSPSLFEGQPNVVLEAIACGCPVVVSDIPAHREFLDEETSSLTATESPSMLASAVLEVLEKPERAARRAERAREKVARWSVGAIGAQYDRAYREILAGRAEPRRRG